MYKDPEKQKEANRLASLRYRQRGMTEQGMTAEGMTEKSPQERAREILPAERFKLIEHLVEKYNEPERYERAISYREWELGKDTTPAYIEALVDKRAMLEFISADLNRKGLRANIWYGVGGVDFETVGELLEVTR